MKPKCTHQGHLNNHAEVEKRGEEDVREREVAKVDKCMRVCYICKAYYV